MTAQSPNLLTMVFRKLLIPIICMIFSSAFAGEGMWLPLLLKSLNQSEMQSMGMKMTAEDIYSVNQGSLKDAIVHFGGFCTSEIISKNGLLLTNHHCGYSQIQSHSSVDNNLLKNGFWAKSLSEELANPGLTATFIDRIEDVTKVILENVTDDMSMTERQSQVDKNIDAYKSKIELKSYEDLSVRPFFHGNQYFAFYKTTYSDVRLVGTPPESIGKFGSDTDNWVWPRHTGDFALFRIYAGPDNLPAEYAEENIPYTPKHHLPISLDGVEEGDFTLVFGFPGRTREYLPSPAVEQVINVLNPAKIEVREKSLAIVDKYMRADEETRIKYASKFARIANYWKKWIGESSGLKRTKAVDKKKNFEKEFMDKLNKKSPYVSLLTEFDDLYKEIEPYALTRDYYDEVTYRNIELLFISTLMGRLVDRFENNGAEAYTSYAARLRPYLEGIMKNYNPEIDKEVFNELVELYIDKVEAIYVPVSLKSKRQISSIADELYSQSSFTSKEKLSAIFDKEPAMAIESIKNDRAYQFSKEWKDVYDGEIAAKYNVINTQLDSLQRIYMKAMMETLPDKRYYPDANSTMRVTYGQVNGYNARDAVYYNPVTYLDGVMEKYKPGDYEFDVNTKLIDLFEKKDYGQYADTNGKIPICFIGSNHTSGGNSGSPAIDANGNLIGLNFDRVWEGTMSDINYDPSICRNIMVDARYILFIVDKFAGASHLIAEMDLVHPKR